MDEHAIRVVQPVVDTWDSFRHGDSTLLDLSRVTEQASDALDSASAELRDRLRHASSELESAFHSSERKEHGARAVTIMASVFESLGTPVPPLLTREELLILLAQTELPSAHEGREALQAGAAFATWYETSSSARDLLPIWRRRAQHVRTLSIRTIGFDEAVGALERDPDARFVLAAIDRSEPQPFNYLVFLRADRQAVVVALGIEGRDEPPTLDFL